MRITVEISKYPLRSDFIPRIQGFIDRLNRYPQLKIRTNETSTQVAGEFNQVMDALNSEIKASFGEMPETIFVMKVLGKDLL